MSRTRHFSRGESRSSTRLTQALSNPKSKRISRIIRIDTPEHFRQSVKTLKKNGLSTHEKRSLVLAVNARRIMLNNPRLSERERMESRQIIRIAKQEGIVNR